MHPSTERARELLDRLEGFDVTQRDADMPDVLTHWEALREQSEPPPQHHRNGSELVYKTYGLPAMQQQASTMDTETEARWNAWCDDRIRRFVEAVASVIGEESGVQQREMQKQIDEMRNELTLLRGEISGTIKKIGRSNAKDAA